MTKATKDFLILCSLSYLKVDVCFYHDEHKGFSLRSHKFVHLVKSIVLFVVKPEYAQ